MRLAQTVGDGRLEGGKVSVVLGIQALLFDEFPQPFNQVEIRRVGRQKTELDLQAGRGGEYHGAFLIAGIVQHQRDRHAEVEVSQLMQQLADTLGGDVGVIGHRNEFVRDRIQGAQDIEALASGRRLDEHPHQRPEKAQKGRQDEMGRIDKEDGVLPGLRFR